MNYKEILKGIVNIINTTEKSDIGFVNICSYIGKNCPELEESDERIRKRLIELIYKVYANTNYITCVEHENILAWLEKQDKKTPVINFKAKDWYVSKVDGQIHNIYYSVDKVEPKFKVGDWIIHQGTENIYKVVARINNQYQLKYGDNYTIQKCADIDRCARLWDATKDAKKGE